MKPIVFILLMFVDLLAFGQALPPPSIFYGASPASGCVAPAITSGPTSVTCVTNTTVAFSVTTTGTTPLTYFWKTNNVNLVDNAQYFGSATSTLWASNVVLTQSGLTFSVGITNACGGIISTGAVLTVNTGGTNAPLWITIEPNGWVADMFVPGLSTNGTYIYGLGESNSISGNERLQVGFTSPGYTDSGTSNALPRLVVGTKVLRYPYPNQLNNYEYLSGAGVILRVALSDFVRANDTITNVAISSGFYTQGGTANYPTNIPNGGVTNASGLNAPRCIAMWSQPGRFLVGSNYQLSLVAFHYSGQQGRPVRAVAFWGVDSAGNRSPTNFVLNPVIDTNQPDANPIVEYTNIIDGSLFAQGSTISNYAKVYPWWGPALDFSDGVNLPGAADYAPQIFYCNKTGGWPGVWALVDTNASGTPKAVTNWVSSTNGTAVPFPNMAAAINAAGATNSAVNGTNSLSNCYILLTNGAYAVWGGANITSRNPADTWLTVMGRPDVNWSNVFLNTKNNSQNFDKTTRLRVFNVICAVSTAANTFDNGLEEVLIDRCQVWTNLNAVNLVASFTNCFFRQTLLRGQRQPSNPQLNQAGSWLKLRGNTYTSFDTVDGRTTAIYPVLAIGNRFLPDTGVAGEEYGFVNDAGVFLDPLIWAYNFMGRQNGLQYAMTTGINNNVNQGTVIAQNVIESVSNVGSSIPLDILFSNRDNEFCTNELFWNNTILANYHPPFNLQGFQNVTMDHYQDLNNIYGGMQEKADVGDVNGNDTNRWSGVWSVGRSGNANANYLKTFTQPAGNERGFDGLNSWFFGNTNAFAFQFLNNAGATVVGGSGAGLGDYHLSTTNSPLASPVIPLTLVLPFDIEGAPRTTNSPPGAYATYK